MKESVLLVLALLVVVRSNINTTQNPVESIPRSCKEKKPVAGNYTATGKFFQIDSMDIYEVGKEENPKVVIAAYDIFGFHPNTFQVADKMANEGSYLVVMPDFFRGKPYRMEDYPAKDKKLKEFLAHQGNWNDAIRTLAHVLNYYKKNGKKNFALYGNCWGGKVASLAAGQISDIKVVAMLHPSGVTEEDIKNMRVPGYLLPSSEDPDMSAMYEILKSKFGENCGHRRFDDMKHGFASARGDFSDRLVQKRVNEAISIVTKFFNANI